MIATPSTLKLRVRADRRCACPGDARHLLVEIEASAVERPDEATRQPLNVAVVIDASGSMQGAPLDAAKRAAAGIIGALSSRDRITVVSFASDIVTHTAGLPADEAGRRQAAAAVESLATRGCTNLAGGWLRGCELAHELGATLDDPSTRVILLSDGHANEGLTDPARLERLADQWRERGVYTSTVGIGADYSAAQLRALAARGGGRMHHAARPQEIVEVVTGELGEILRTVADDLRLEVAVPAGARVTPLGPWPCATAAVSDGATLAIVACGTLVSRQRVSLALRVDLAALPAEGEACVTVGATWRVPGETARAAAVPTRIAWQLDPWLALHDGGRDTEVSEAVARLWLAWLDLVATEWQEASDWAAARRAIEEARAEFTAYCRGLPAERELTDDFGHRCALAGGPVDMMLCKESAAASLKMMRGEADLRSRRGAMRGRRPKRA